MCYDKFGWDAEQVKKLPLIEAHMLSILFEEEAAYEYKVRRDSENSAHARPDEKVDMFFSDDDPEQAAYGTHIEVS